MSVAKQLVSFRFNPDDWQQIVHDAKTHRLTRTQYVADKLLDRLASVGLDNRVEALEERLTRLERRVDLGYE